MIYAENITVSFSLVPFGDKTSRANVEFENSAHQNRKQAISVSAFFILPSTFPFLSVALSRAQSCLVVLKKKKFPRSRFSRAKTLRDSQNCGVVIYRRRCRITRTD
jgi:hypothetical protein